VPIYLYKCPTCKHQIEILRSINAPGTPECTECSRVGLEVEMEKQPVVTHVHFAGKGWAKDGYST
jgi:putative FmdB family regulatory protein